MYKMGNVPDDPRGLVGFLRRELANIQRAFTGQADFYRLNVLNAAPAKTFDGMIICADGVNFNPGSGQGFYGYYNSSWHFLG